MILLFFSIWLLSAILNLQKNAGFFNELFNFYILLNHDMGFQHFFGKKAIDFHHTNNFAIFYGIQYGGRPPSCFLIFFYFSLSEFFHQVK